jgi:hypothetical protein
MASTSSARAGAGDEDAASRAPPARDVKGKPAPLRGTLTPADLTPAWRGQVQRRASEVQTQDCFGLNDRDAAASVTPALLKYRRTSPRLYA